MSRPQGNFFCRVLPRTLCTGETQECQTAVFASVVAFVNSIDKKKSPVCTFQLLTKLGLLLHFWTPHSFCLQRLVQPWLHGWKFVADSAAVKLRDVDALCAMSAKFCAISGRLHPLDKQTTLGAERFFDASTTPVFTHMRPTPLPKAPMLVPLPSVHASDRAPLGSACVHRPMVCQAVAGATNECKVVCSSFLLFLALHVVLWCCSKTGPRPCWEPLVTATLQPALVHTLAE